MNADRLHIRIRRPASLSAAQEATVLREACRREQVSPYLRRRLARILLAEDMFTELVELLEPLGALGPDEISIYLQGRLARETPEDNRHVVRIVDDIGAMDAGDAFHAQWLADQGKAYRRLGRIDEARSALRRALSLDPANSDACKRMVAIELATGAPDAALAVLDRLECAGVAHARLLADRDLVHAMTGEMTAAHTSLGADAFHFSGMLDTPHGFTDLSDFNEALAARLLKDPRRRTGRYGAASLDSWRIDRLEDSRSDLVALLLDRIARAAEGHAAVVAKLDHPWSRGTPQVGELQSWCVMTGAAGHETWHLHETGWMSGVYYVKVPPSVASGTGDEGCIAFGLPEDVIGADAASRFGRRVVRPQEGLLLLFPSHSYHRSFPHGSAEPRICVAFDILRSGIV